MTGAPDPPERHAAFPSFYAARPMSRRHISFFGPIALLLAAALPLTVAYGAKVAMEGDIGLTTLTAALLTVVLVWRHRDNIVRLAAGEESRIDLSGS